MLNIFWFRKDLRISDNRGLQEFVKAVDGKFLFLYIKNKNSFNYFGEKRIYFLLECLVELKSDLKSKGFELQIAEGKSPEIFQKILKENKTVNVFCNEQVEPYCIKRDKEIEELIQKGGGSFKVYTDSTLFPLGKVMNGEGNQYKVFTPFKNEAMNILMESDYAKCEVDVSELNDNEEIILKALPGCDIQKEQRSLDKSELLRGGRNEGLSLLKEFYEKGLSEYTLKRDFPSVEGTSKLSAHLHFGTIGIREAFRTGFIKLKKSKAENARSQILTWIKELLWREFYYNISYHNPQILSESFQKEYDDLKWSYDEDDFNKWCEGRTGFPIVDAGMRQLNLEGWMHNRVRMITAMFLTKDLFIDWRLGEKYFAEKLIDLDFSSNNGGWQWSASTGVDAQPYFRVFNPYLQSKKFDEEGLYIKKYLPELRSVPKEFIHEPHLMSDMEQTMYGVTIGKDYPGPITDHSKAKTKAIENFKNIKNKF